MARTGPRAGRGGGEGGASGFISDGEGSGGGVEQPSQMSLNAADGENRAGKKERKKKKRGFHLNNLFRGSSCLTPGGFLLSIWTVFCRTPPIHTHTPVPVFKSASRLLLLARGRSTLARLVPSSAAWYAAPLTPLGGSCVWRSLFTSPCAPGDTGE